MNDSLKNDSLMNDRRVQTEADAAVTVEDIVRRAGTSFYWAMRRLPENKRRAMYGIYAFCREVDDIADGDDAVADKLAGLGQWRGEIERLYGDQPRTPVTLALSRAVGEFGLKKEDFRAVIDGMEMDAVPEVRITDMDELTLYCDRVACAVGRLSVQVFGLGEEMGKKLAFAQGLALQLTNILRDIADDARQGRLYIPRDLLDSYNITVGDIAADGLSSVLRHPAFPKACDTLAGVAEQNFEKADAVIAECDHGKIRPAIVMMETYRRIFGKLKRRGWQHFDLPVRLSKPGKLWIALRYGIF